MDIRLLANSATPTRPPSGLRLSNTPSIRIRTPPVAATKVFQDKALALREAPD